MKRIAVFVLCATMPIALYAQTLTTLHSFDGTDGTNPNAPLAQATNGDLYGTTSGDEGTDGFGTVFKITPSGTLTTLYNFCPVGNPCIDGASPRGLVQATNGELYGITSSGGANNTCAGVGIVGLPGCGTVFKITPSGTLTTLHSFDGTDGFDPNAGLVQAANGDLYGTTAYGANDACNLGFRGCGTIFKITPSGTLTTLHSFDGTDGSTPEAGLVQGANGDLYGTTWLGGPSNIIGGTIFKITPSGALTTLYSFCSQGDPCTDGYEPNGLVQATNGDFYGTTFGGGAAGGACVGCGTIFKITPDGTLTTLHSFDGTDGANPNAPLVQATNGELYGTTSSGGPDNINGGTVFKITPGGTLTTIYSFCSRSGCTDGEYPVARLVQDTSGDLYGTTALGGDTSTCGSASCGTIFGLSLGLGPFVETRPTAGEVGAFVEILGSDLTGVTGVTFNGIAATFTVVSRSLITATVPARASTGTVQVVTPGGTLSSNVSFRVP
jgi:uncharacterized repeat protein (TIGR03803 family)